MTISRRLLVLSLSLSCSALAACGTAHEVKETQGFAEVYLRQRQQTFSVSASVSLPEKPNVSWYSSWLMVVPFADGTAPFIEIGLMRRPNKHNVVTPFISTLTPAAALPTYREDLPEIANDASPHRVEAVVDDTTIALRFDGKEVQRFSRATYFPRKTYDRLYEQIGSEVSTYGDAISGGVSNIAIADLDGTTIASYPTCGSQNAGITLGHLGDAYTASGSFRQGSEPPEVRFVKLPSMEVTSTC